jgi:hypothetical protein
MFGMTSSKVNFIYSIEVDREVGLPFEIMAPMILGLGEMIQQSNNILGLTKEPLKVNILPVKPGSVQIEIMVHTGLSVALSSAFFATNPQENIRQLLAILGLIKDGSQNVLDLVRLFKGEKPRVGEAGTLIYGQNIDSNISINAPVGKLINSPIIQNFYAPVYGVPLGLDGVTGLKTFIKEDLSTISSITKDDLPFIEKFSSKNNTTQKDQSSGESASEKEVFLKFKRVSADGEGDNWSFYLGGNIITASIRDLGFLDSVKKGLIRPNAVDIFKVKLLETTKNENSKTSLKYEIVEVLDYQKGQNQEVAI